MIDLDRLERIFEKRYRELAHEAKDDEFFVNWCDKHKVLIMHDEWVREIFNEPRKNMVCIFHPLEFEKGASLSSWLLVPKKFAERILVLGYLP